MCQPVDPGQSGSCEAGHLTEDAEGWHIPRPKLLIPVPDCCALKARNDREDIKTLIKKEGCIHRSRRRDVYIFMSHIRLTKGDSEESAMKAVTYECT